MSETASAEQIQDPPVPFFAPTGAIIPLVELAELRRIIDWLVQEGAISLDSLIEGAAYSLAMVLRSALGLSASSGRVLVLVTSDLGGAVALAAARQLSNAGATVRPIFVPELVGQADNLDQLKERLSANFDRQCAALAALGIEVSQESIETLPALLNLELVSYHAVIWGDCSLPGDQGFTPERTDQVNRAFKQIVELFNNSAVPVHSIVAPAGLLDYRSRPNSVLADAVLFSSSTMSLGVSLQFSQREAEHLGRHYLADISIPAKSYQGELEEFIPPFCEQPVIRLVSAEDQTT